MTGFQSQEGVVAQYLMLLVESTKQYHEQQQAVQDNYCTVLCDLMEALRGTHKDKLAGHYLSQFTKHTKSAADVPLSRLPKAPPKRPRPDQEQTQGPLHRSYLLQSAQNSSSSYLKPSRRRPQSTYRNDCRRSVSNPFEIHHGHPDYQEASDERFVRPLKPRTAVADRRQSRRRHGSFRREETRDLFPQKQRTPPQPLSQQRDDAPPVKDLASEAIDVIQVTEDEVALTLASRRAESVASSSESRQPEALSSFSASSHTSISSSEQLLLAFAAAARSPMSAVKKNLQVSIETKPSSLEEEALQQPIWPSLQCAWGAYLNDLNDATPLQVMPKATSSTPLTEMSFRASASPVLIFPSRDALAVQAVVPHKPASQPCKSMLPGRRRRRKKRAASTEETSSEVFELRRTRSVDAMTIDDFGDSPISSLCRANNTVRPGEVDLLSNLGHRGAMSKRRGRRGRKKRRIPTAQSHTHVHTHFYKVEGDEQIDSTPLYLPITRRRDAQVPTSRSVSTCVPPSGLLYVPWRHSLPASPNVEHIPQRLSHDVLMLTSSVQRQSSASDVVLIANESDPSGKEEWRVKATDPGGGEYE